MHDTQQDLTTHSKLHFSGYDSSSLRQFGLGLLDPVLQIPHTTLAQAFPLMLR